MATRRKDPSSVTKSGAAPRPVRKAEPSLEAPTALRPASRRVSRKTAAAAEPALDALTLEGRLGYRFRDPALLRLALTHSSFVYENGLAEPPVPKMELAAAASPRAADRQRTANPPGTDNEQLELLGDAVVGLLVTELLLAAFPDRSEGELTRMRSFLVSRRRLAQTGAELHLDRDLHLGPTAEASGARHSTSMLANATEALLAALYLDANRVGEDGLALTRRLVERLLLHPELPSLRQAVAESHGRDTLRDSKSTLQERVQAVNAGQLRYADIAETGPPHDRRFTVAVELVRRGETHTLAQADGRSKKEAQQTAAGHALQSWNPALWQASA